jgi:AcrR family transcriptional regulator
MSFLLLRWIESRAKIKPQNQNVILVTEVWKMIQKDPRKAKIIEAAQKTFALFGYKGTTVDQIAKMAGVGKGTIYNFFENKEELLGAIIENLIVEMRKVADAALAEEVHLFDRLHRAIYGILMFRKEHEVIIRLSLEVNELGSAVAQNALRTIEDEVVGYIRNQLEKAVAGGRIRPCDPEITAFVLLKLYVSLVFDWEKRHEPLSNERISELIRLYVMEGLARPE